MSVRLDGSIIHLEGPCGVEEAETLAAPSGSATVWCDWPGTTARF